jgi:hypothetical protein
MGRILVRGQLGQKSFQDTISNNKMGVVVLACHPSYTGGIGRRILVQVQPKAKT